MFLKIRLILFPIIIFCSFKNFDQNLSLSFVSPAHAAKNENTSTKSLKIFIDPGHGGKDPGAFVDGIKESDITFKTSKLLEERLLKLGHQVRLSRESLKSSVSLRKRVKKANEWGADLVLSIHANSSTHKQIRGAEFFIDNPFKPNSEDYEVIASKEASKRESLRWDFIKNIKEESHSKKTSLATLEKLAQFEKSHQLAKSLSSFWQVHKLPSGKEKSLIFTSPLFMLKHSPIPTVLIELGYISHPVEQEMLISEIEQKKFANKIAKGLMSFLDKHSLK